MMVWTAEQDAQVRDLVMKGMSRAAIAVALGFTTGQVNGRARRLGLRASSVERPEKATWTPERDAKMIRMANDGERQIDIARVLGVSRRRVGLRFGALGMKFPSRPRIGQTRAVKIPKCATRQSPEEIALRRKEASERAMRLREAAANEAVQNAIPLVGRARSACAWPVGAPSSPEHQLCCGRRVVDKRPYCADHMPVAHTNWSPEQ